jgi:HTH-type transcriptional regulator, sugar sensing transcriptional regulator
LQEKGLVAYTIHDKIKYFSPTDPKKLIEILKEKEKKVLGILPELEKIKEIAKNKQSIFIYEGSKALKVVFNDILHTLKRGDEQLVIGVSHTGSGMSEFIRRWDKHRMKAGIRKKVLITDSNREWLDYYKHQPLTQVKILPKFLTLILR